MHHNRQSLGHASETGSPARARSIGRRLVQRSLEKKAGLKGQMATVGETGEATPTGHLSTKPGTDRTKRIQMHGKKIVMWVKSWGAEGEGEERGEEGRKRRRKRKEEEKTTHGQ